MDKLNFCKAKKLIGNELREEQLKHVDCFIGNQTGIFIPVTGYCGYAITRGHTHPSYSFVISFKYTEIPYAEKKDHEIMDTLKDNYLLTALSPDIPHQEEKGEKFIRYIAVFIDKELFQKVYKEYTGENCPRYNMEQFMIHKNIMYYITQFMSEYEQKKQGYHEVTDYLEKLIVHMIIRSILHEDENETDLIQRFDIQEVLEYINEHLEEKLNIEKLAQVIKCSTATLIRAFKKETGKTPGEYVIEARLKRARRLLEETDMRMTEVALKCGFCSPSHFSSCFVKHIGTTPSAYAGLFR